jgi:chorismate mutase/prephenate dehydratase
MNENEKLRTIRARIDALDEQLQTLLNDRARYAQEVAEIKEVLGEEEHFYRPEREAQILSTVAARNQGPLPSEDMVRLFREILSACLALQKPIHIAYLGPAGTFTQLAVLKHFGQSVGTIPLPAIDEVFREVAAGAATYGVVPVENSTEGVVNHTLDMFMRSPLAVCGEVELRVHHHLMGVGVDADQITRVYSHQQSLAQCREWLDAKLPNAARAVVSSNAEGARRAKGEPGTAAIASELAAATYGLDILERNIEDEPNNTTRFLVIGEQAVPPSGVDKTSLLISARNRPGALFKLLAPLARNGISMTRIESRPARSGLWEYVFFVDVEGHKDEPKVMEALDELQQEAALFRILGSYPKALL